MGICDDCSLEEKIHVCCARHPLTGEQAPFRSGDVSMPACPMLAEDGLCGDYGARPRGCREFFCDAYRRMEASAGPWTGMTGT